MDSIRESENQQQQQDDKKVRLRKQWRESSKRYYDRNKDKVKAKVIKRYYDKLKANL
jgi:hypothetical protein